jgi:hypothetical protein
VAVRNWEPRSSRPGSTGPADQYRTAFARAMHSDRRTRLLSIPGDRGFQSIQTRERETGCQVLQTGSFPCRKPVFQIEGSILFGIRFCFL